MSTEGITSLRDTVAAALDEHAVEAPQVEAPPVETEEQRAERIRDEKGRFAAKAETPVEAKVETPAEPKPRPQRPSSWAKDYWDDWEKLDPRLADYIHKREQDYAKGVSTYKNEAEQAKSVNEALAPFMPLLQQHNIEPKQWISNLGNAHRTLVFGSPQEKLYQFQKLAQDYGVPLQALTGQGFDPLQYVNPLYEKVQQLEGKLTTWQTQQEKAQQETVQREIESFAGKHPHFEQVRNTMSGLLQSGLADDLESAYQAAIRLPQHSEISTALQQQQREQEERERKEKSAQQVRTARANVISPKSATPMTDGAKATKGLRSSLEAAFEQHSGGRV